MTLFKKQLLTFSAALVFAISLLLYGFFYQESGQAPKNNEQLHTRTDSQDLSGRAQDRAAAGVIAATNNQRNESTRESEEQVSDDHHRIASEAEGLGLVNANNAVDGEKLSQLMSADQFDQYVEQIAASQNKSRQTLEFESSIDDYIIHSEFSVHVSNYQVSCDNKICLGYFRSFSKDELDVFINDFYNSGDSPVRTSGFVNVYAKSTDEAYEYRVSFNSDPEVSAITVPNGNR